MLKPDELINQRYLLSAPLGTRGISSVWQATDRIGDRQVALVLVEPGGLEGFDRVDHFLAQMKQLKPLLHHRLVKVFDFGRADDGRGFAAMELLSGVPLSERIREKSPLNLSDFILIISQALDGLSRLHRAKLVHGDIEPGNLLILSGHSPPAVKLIGIGHGRAAMRCRLEPPRPDDQGFVRSLIYASPEQVRGEAEPDRRTDLYSVGLMVFEAISGRRLLGSRTIEGICAEIQSTRAPSLDRICFELPRGFSEVIERATAPSPEDRFETASAMKAELLKSMLKAPEDFKRALVTPKGLVVPAPSKSGAVARHPTAASPPPPKTTLSPAGSIPRVPGAPRESWKPPPPTALRPQSSTPASPFEGTTRDSVETPPPEGGSERSKTLPPPPPTWERPAAVPLKPASASPMPPPPPQGAGQRIGRPKRTTEELSLEDLSFIVEGDDGSRRDLPRPVEDLPSPKTLAEPIPQESQADESEEIAPEVDWADSEDEPADDAVDDEALEDALVEDVASDDDLAEDADELLGELQPRRQWLMWAIYSLIGLAFVGGITSGILMSVGLAESGEEAGGAPGGRPAPSPVPGARVHSASPAAGDAASSQATPDDAGGESLGEAAASDASHGTYLVKLLGLPEGAQVRLDGVSVEGANIELPFDGAAHELEVETLTGRRWKRTLRPSSRNDHLFDVASALGRESSRRSGERPLSPRPPRRPPPAKSIPSLVRDPGF